MRLAISGAAAARPPLAVTGIPTAVPTSASGAGGAAVRVAVGGVCFGGCAEGLGLVGA